MFEEFKLYRDQYGLNQLSTKNGVGETTQNGTLFTTQYLICLLENNDNHSQEEIKRVKEVFDTCEPYPGLSSRSPDSREVDSMDNQSALLTFSALYGNGEYATRMYEYGQNTRINGMDMVSAPELTLKTYPLAWLINGFKLPKNVWNVEAPGKFNIRAWWGRSPSLLGLSRMTAGKWCNPLLWLSVLVGQFTGAFVDKNNSDARTLPFVVWQYLKTRSVFWRLAYKVWYFILKRYYPDGMRDVYAQYYRDQNHPIIKYTKS